jgi:hypothetical protein
MRTVTTILAAAAIAVAPIAIFTMAPASAAPVCVTGAVPVTPACSQCILSNSVSAASTVCFGDARPTAGCPGLGLDANGCANHIARCAAGTGPCPY